MAADTQEMPFREFLPADDRGAVCRDARECGKRRTGGTASCWCSCAKRKGRPISPACASSSSAPRHGWDRGAVEQPIRRHPPTAGHGDPPGTVLAHCGDSTWQWRRDHVRPVSVHTPDSLLPRDCGVDWASVHTQNPMAGRFRRETWCVAYN